MISRSLSRLLERNRSHRAFDASFRVREDQLRRIIEVATKVPSARNQQVLRFRPVLADEASKILPHIRLGGALPHLKLPVAGSEPNAFVVICSTVEMSHYVSVAVQYGYAAWFVARGKANLATVEHLLQVGRGHYVVVDAVAVLLLQACIEQGEACGYNHSIAFEFFAR